MLLLGRLGNLLVYLLLAVLAVRLAHPGHKWLFAAAALLPMSLQLAGSLSADAWCWVWCSATPPFCFALRQRAGAPWQILLLLILAACVGPAKAIYLPVVLLCLLIPTAHLELAACCTCRTAENWPGADCGRQPGQAAGRSAGRGLLGAGQPRCPAVCHPGRGQCGPDPRRRCPGNRRGGAGCCILQSKAAHAGAPDLLRRGHCRCRDRGTGGVFTT